MRKIRRGGGPLIPPWEMPSDPVRAVVWFFHWTLKILARFFWILILGAVIVESLMNGLIGGIITLLVGLTVWMGIVIVLWVFNTLDHISQTVVTMNQLREDIAKQQFTSRPYSAFTQKEREMEREGRVVEGSVTDLEEERRKRRPE